MKVVPLRDIGEISTVTVIRGAIERPANGATISEMRAGIRVLDALDKATGGDLLLEDQDHATLVNAINVTRFTIVNRDLMTIIDDIVNAAAPPQPPASAGKAA